MTAVEILDGLERDGILRVVSTEFATDEALFEVRDGMVRLVELRGYAKTFNSLTGILCRYLSKLQDEAWENEGGYEGLDHELSDTFLRLGSAISNRFHPISISQRAHRAMKETQS